MLAAAGLVTPATKRLVAAATVLVAVTGMGG
jgi:hypothetical protein